MIKLIYSDSFDDLANAGARLIEDRHQLKIASKDSSVKWDYDEIKPDKNHVGIHVVALGDFETYGANRNGDGFPKQACINYHDTFVKFGNVYRHHRNKDPKNALGKIVKSAYNEQMGRIELFIHANKEKAADELERLSKEGEIPVSMACFVGGTLVRVENGFAPIEAVKVGDFVLSHNGTFQKVTAKTVRDVQEYLIFEFFGFGDLRLGVTENHEIAFISREHFLNNKQDLLSYISWSLAKNIRPGDYLLMPILTEEAYILDENLIRSTVISLLQNNTNVPRFILEAKKESKLLFLKYLYQHIGHQTARGIVWRVLNRGTAIDLQNLLASLQIPSFCEYEFLDNYQTSAYCVTVSYLYFDKLSNIISLTDFINKDFNKFEHSYFPIIFENYLLIAVKSVTLYSSATPVPVYNLSVDSTETYNAYGLAVHNCKVAYDVCTICGTKRKHSHDPNQCDHIRNHLGQVFEDGKIACTLNPEPCFFDISFVGRPADRIAWSLKVASDEVVSSTKLAEKEQVFVPDVLAIDLASQKRKYEIANKLSFFENLYKRGNTVSSRERYFFELIKSAGFDYDESAILELRDYPVDLVLAGLAKRGCVLPPKAFFTYIFGNNFGEFAPYFPQLQEKMGSVYTSAIQSNLCQNFTNNSDFDVNSYLIIPAAVDRCVQKLAFSFSVLPSVSEARTVEFIVSGKTIKTAQFKNFSYFDLNQIIKTCLNKYASYQLSALDAILQNYVNEDRDAIFAATVAQNFVI